MIRSIPSRPTILALTFALTAALAVLSAGCGGPSATATPKTQIRIGPTQNGVTPILATTVLRLGTQRVAFLLEGETDIVRAPSATVRTLHLDSPRSGQTATAMFHLWPYGVRGAYATELTFDQSGRWRLDIEAHSGDAAQTATLDVEVAERSPVVDVGELPPLRPNKTRRDVAGLADLTSDPTVDPALYELTIPEAAISGRPSVIVFASPAFCTSPTCGPQVDAVSELRATYASRANFIHVEVYDNPVEIQGDLTRGVYAPVVDDWGLTSLPGWLNESWVFLLGRDGRVTHRFEGFATGEELGAALDGLL